MDASAFKARREALGYTQAQLAVALDVGIRTIRRWEYGDAQTPRVAELALRYLAGETRPEPEAPAHE